MTDYSVWVAGSPLSGSPSAGQQTPLAAFELRVHGPAGKDVELRWGFADAMATDAQRRAFVNAALAALAELAERIEPRGPHPAVGPVFERRDHG